MLGHIKRERAPTAAELENVLAVGELSALASQAKHDFFSLRKRRAAFGKKGRAVFAARAENDLKEFRWNFIVLGVSGIGSQRDRAALHCLDESQLRRSICFVASAILFLQSCLKHLSNGGANREIRHEAALDERLVPEALFRLVLCSAKPFGVRGFVGCRLRHAPAFSAAILLGNQGINALVVFWYSRYWSPRLRSACSSVAGIPVTPRRKYRISAGERRPSQPHGDAIANVA